MQQDMREGIVGYHKGAHCPSLKGNVIPINPLPALNASVPYRDTASVYSAPLEKQVERSVESVCCPIAVLKFYYCINTKQWSTCSAATTYVDSRLYLITRAFHI